MLPLPAVARFHWLQCSCEWNGADEPLKGMTIPVDYAFVEIISGYKEIHYSLIATDSSASASSSFDDDDA
jgi:hypothetical protein